MDHDWESAAKELWRIIDDIDMYGDHFKPKRTDYFYAVCNKAKDRFAILESDGYTLYIPGTRQKRKGAVAYRAQRLLGRQ